MQIQGNATIAVVITTYNNPKSLELCLTTLLNQTHPHFDVFIADDGSGDSTRDLILNFKKKSNFMIYHFWHPDQGYQKAKINNTVFKQIDPQRYPVLICIDHDVILHPRFVEDHFREHAKDQFKPLLFMGRRVDLSEQLTAQLTVDNVNGFTSRLSLKLLKSILKKETKHGLRSLRIDLPPFFSTLFKRDRVYDLLGSNYSIQTQALLDVNGYNEDYRSYWGEDGDLFVRVRNSRIPIRGKIGYAVQWHLYHQRLEETQAHVEQYQRLLLDTQYCRCKNGITKT